jgi:hypothetical protein
VGKILWSRRVAPVTAVTIGVLTLGLAVVSVPLDYLSRRPGAVPGDVIGIGTVGAGVAVGALVAARRPRNPIGWILLAIFSSLTSPPARTPSWITGCITGRCLSARWRWRSWLTRRSS